MPKVKLPDGTTAWATDAGAHVLAARATDRSSESPGRPAETAPRAIWDDYARHIGLDPHAFSSKAKLIDAINSGRA